MGNPAAVREGQALAERRRAAMRRLIRLNPRQALAVAIDPMLAYELPTEIAAHLEEHVAGYGTLNIWVDEGGGASQIQAVVINGRMYQAHTYGRRLGFNTFKQLIPLWGVAVGTDMAVAEDSARLISSGEMIARGEFLPEGEGCASCGRRGLDMPQRAAALLGSRVLALCSADHLNLLNAAVAGAEGGSAGAVFGPSPQWTRGEKKLLFIIAQYADQASPPTTRGAAETALAKVEAYYQAQSYGLTTLASTITDPVLLTQTTSYYNSRGLALLYNDAVEAARADGWEADAHDFVVIRHAGGPGGIGSGLVGQKGAWIKSDHVGLICHELGHNYGLNHANGWLSYTTAPYGPGTTVEYGDAFDIMGPNQGSFNSYEKHLLHWFPASAHRVATHSGVYRLHAFDAPVLEPDRLYALRASKDVRDYWLDYRGEFRSGTLAPFALNGLQIRWPAWSQSRGGSTLLDTTPGTSGQFLDAPLALGHTFSDTQAGVHVTVLDRSPVPGQWIEVVIQLGSFPGNQKPTGLLAATATNVMPGEPVTFTVTAQDPDNDPVAFGWSFSWQTVGGSNPRAVPTNNSPVQTCSWTVPGEYEVRCVISDMKGGTTAPTFWVTVGSPTNYVVSGQVLETNGAPAPNVRVFLLPETQSLHDSNHVTHPDYRTIYSDTNGLYRLANIPAGRYGLFAQPTVTRIFPRSGSAQTVTLGPGLSGIDFVALPKPPRAIHGLVRDGTAPVSDAVVRLENNIAISDATGAFAFADLPPASYTLSASRGEDQFIAINNPVYVDTNDLTGIAVDRVLYQISGEIRAVVGPASVGTSEPGRWVPAMPSSGDLTQPWLYRLNLPRGLWHVQAALPGLTYRPLGFTNPVLILGVERPSYTPQGIQPTTQTNLHFEGRIETTYAIRGRILSGNAAVVGVTVSLGGLSAQTDSLGNYVLAALAPGEYSLTPFALGFRFIPDRWSVNVATNDLSEINFAADLQPMERWRTNFFSAMERLNSQIGADDADPDRDGIRNIFEYALGLHPRSAEAGGLPYATVEGERLILNYTKPAEATDIEYLVEGSNALPGPWNAPVRFVGESGGALRFVRWRHDIPVTATNQGYLRLHVVRQ